MVTHQLLLLFQHLIPESLPCAINLVRVWEWWTDAYTFGTTPSRFAALAL